MKKADISALLFSDEASMRINALAQAALEIAKRRKKVNVCSTDIRMFNHMVGEMEECCEILNSGHDGDSQHLYPNLLDMRQYTHLDEEITDVLIVCLTWLAWRKKDVHSLVRQKMMFNLNRKD